MRHPTDALLLIACSCPGILPGAEHDFCLPRLAWPPHAERVAPGSLPYMRCSKAVTEGYARNKSVDGCARNSLPKVQESQRVQGCRRWQIVVTRTAQLGGPARLLSE